MHIYKINERSYVYTSTYSCIKEPYMSHIRENLLQGWLNFIYVNLERGISNVVQGGDCEEKCPGWFTTWLIGVSSSSLSNPLHLTQLIPLRLGSLALVVWPSSTSCWGLLAEVATLLGPCTSYALDDVARSRAKGFFFFYYIVFSDFTPPRSLFQAIAKVKWVQLGSEKLNFLCSSLIIVVELVEMYEA